MDLTDFQQGAVYDLSGEFLLGVALAGRLVPEGGEFFEQFGGAGLADGPTVCESEFGFESGDGSGQGCVGRVWVGGAAAVAESLDFGAAGVANDIGREGAQLLREVWIVGGRGIIEFWSVSSDGCHFLNLKAVGV